MKWGCQGRNADVQIAASEQYLPAAFSFFGQFLISVRRRLVLLREYSGNTAAVLLERRQIPSSKSMMEKSPLMKIKPHRAIQASPFACST